MSRWRDTRKPQNCPHRRGGVSSTWGAYGARRSTTRIVFSGDARVVCGREVFTATSGDLSMGGVLLNMTDPPTVGERVRVSLNLKDGTTILVEGMVRWHPCDSELQATGCGIEFTELTDSQMGLLQSIIEAGEALPDPSEVVDDAPVQRTLAG